MRVLECYTFKTGADELVWFSVNVDIIKLISFDTGYSAGITKNKRKMKPHQIVRNFIILPQRCFAGIAFSEWYKNIVFFLTKVLLCVILIA